MASPRSHHLKLGTGLSYHLLEWDGGGDHTVILIHGFLDQARSWEAMLEAGFDVGLHVLAPDMRGHGDSEWIGAGGYYHFPDYLADLHEIVEARARPRLSLVGHSMGGSIAAYYTGTFPARVERLALLEGLGPQEASDSTPDRVAAWLSACKRVRERAPKSYESVAAAAARLLALDPLLSAAQAQAMAARWTTVVADGRVRFKHDPLHTTPSPLGFSTVVARQFWTRVRCPTLLVYGGASRLRLPQEEEERRASAFADARTVVLEGAGHTLQRHQPSALARCLRQFLLVGGAG